MNPSKITDPRQWRKWAQAGAIAAFPGVPIAPACYWCGETVCICFESPEDDTACAEMWLCVAGHCHEDGLHCPSTGQEPPWGCPCGHCQDGDGEEDDPLCYLPPYGDDWL